MIMLLFGFGFFVAGIVKDKTLYTYGGLLFMALSVLAGGI